MSSIFSSVDYYAWSNLVNGVVAVLFGLTIYAHNWRSQKNIFFALYSLSIGVWALFYFGSPEKVIPL